MELMKLTPTAKAPTYATEGAACADLYADIPLPIMVRPGDTVTILTGIAIHIKQPCLVGLVFPRSGWATKHDIKLKNTIGVIDSDYQGEIIINLTNEGRGTMFVNPGDRVAQIGFFPVNQACFEEVKQFSTKTNRGTGGFGSTGL